MELFDRSIALARRNKVSVAIISTNRRLRFAYRMLLSEETDNRIEVLSEGPSLQEMGVWAKRDIEPDVLLIDDKQVYKNRKKYFSFLRQMYPHSGILLMIDEEASNLTDDIKNFVKGVVKKSCSPETLVSAIFDIAVPKKELV
ncbi:hypothetical protein FAZ19_17950 [Sphingobacterium alkalisoli]|uniref:Response regulatory domain-containing protein n=1 Tax=Sphingobacterium alkalisoli TaxID=1874115 RepID=A0A4U0GXR5_9SPHI|nr:hypothetical protein [Sphingobacterium alkalisoli]TJY63464.1 hypothetical protein FAZ19_17950 [Sphingobacterium alkalisoli]